MKRPFAFALLAFLISTPGPADPAVWHDDLPPPELRENPEKIPVERLIDYLKRELAAGAIDPAKVPDREFLHTLLKHRLQLTKPLPPHVVALFDQILNDESRNAPVLKKFDEKQDRKESPKELSNEDAMRKESEEDADPAKEPEQDPEKPRPNPAAQPRKLTESGAAPADRQDPAAPSSGPGTGTVPAPRPDVRTISRGQAPARAVREFETFRESLARARAVQQGVDRGLVRATRLAEDAHQTKGKPPSVARRRLKLAEVRPASFLTRALAAEKKAGNRPAAPRPPGRPTPVAAGPGPVPSAAVAAAASQGKPAPKAAIPPAAPVPILKQALAALPAKSSPVGSAPVGGYFLAATDPVAALPSFSSFTISGLEPAEEEETATELAETEPTFAGSGSETPYEAAALLGGWDAWDGLTLLALLGLLALGGWAKAVVPVETVVPRNRFEDAHPSRLFDSFWASVEGRPRRAPAATAEGEAGGAYYAALSAAWASTLGLLGYLARPLWMLLVARRRRRDRQNRL